VQLTKSGNGIWTLIESDGAVYSFGAADQTTGVAKLTSVEYVDTTPGNGKLTYTFASVIGPLSILEGASLLLRDHPEGTIDEDVIGTSTSSVSFVPYALHRRRRPRTPG
jgi:hypothetical protein